MKSQQHRNNFTGRATAGELDQLGVVYGAVLGGDPVVFGDWRITVNFQGTLMMSGSFKGISFQRVRYHVPLFENGREISTTKDCQSRFLTG